MDYAIAQQLIATTTQVTQGGSGTTLLARDNRRWGLIVASDETESVVVRRGIDDAAPILAILRWFTGDTTVSFLNRQDIVMRRADYGDALADQLAITCGNGRTITITELTLPPDINAKIAEVFHRAK